MNSSKNLSSRPRRTVVPTTRFEATPGQCKSSAAIIASNTQNKRGPKRNGQVDDRRDSTEERSSTEEDNTQKRNKLEPSPSATSTSGQSISNSSLACNSTSKAGTTHKPEIDVGDRSRTSEVVAAPSTAIVKNEVDDEDVMVIEEKLAGNVSTHNVEPVTAQVKPQYSYPITQSSQHENKQAQSSHVTNFIQKTEAATFEKLYMTQKDLIDVKLGNIETQPLQAIKFNCPFDLPRVNYFKVKNLSEHRIGIMINASSVDRIDLDTRLACLRPLQSITIKVTTRSFDLKEFAKDFIAIEWMNVLDNTVLTDEWFCGDGPRNKKTLIVEYSL